MKKGISLVALVITIIVLIVLTTGIVLLSGGHDGIVGKANAAVNKNNKQVVQEKVIMAIGSAKVDAAEYGQSFYEYLSIDANKNKFIAKGFDEVNLEENSIKIAVNGILVEVDRNGKVLNVRTEDEEINKITFTIQGIGTYEAIEGMTWADWVLSYSMSSISNGIVWFGFETPAKVYLDGPGYQDHINNLYLETKANYQTAGDVLIDGAIYKIAGPA